MAAWSARGWTAVQGDCHQLLADVPDHSVQLVLCDPPYATTRKSWDRMLDWPEIWKQYRRILAPRGAVVLFGTKPFTFHLGATAPKGWYRHDWIWEKSKATGALNKRVGPMRAHEELLVFGPQSPRYQPQLRSGRPYNKGLVKAQPEDDLYGKHRQVVVQSEDGTRQPRSVLYHKTAEAFRSRDPLLVQTQKPVELLQYLVRTYSGPGDLVLDHCMGSGSTGVAALREGRRFYGMERGKQLYAKACAWLIRTQEEQEEWSVDEAAAAGVVLAV